MCQKLKEAETLIDKTDFISARKLLSSLEFENIADLRKKEQLQALCDIRTGDYHSALNKLISIKNNYGEHLRVLADISVCYYMTGKIQNWKSSFKELEDRYNQYFSHLSQETALRVGIMIAIYHEEMADISKAIHCYEKLHQSFEVNDSPECYRLLANLLRIKTSFDIKENYQGLYTELIQMTQSTANFMSLSEVQHALTLSEISLFGSIGALSRLKLLFNTESFIPYDLQITYFDFIEEHLVRGLTLPEGLNALSLKSKQFDPYETFLLDTLNHQPIQYDLVFNSSQTLSKANYLRILALSHMRESSSDIKIEILKRIKEIFVSLDSESRELWKRRYKNIFKQNDHEATHVVFNHKNKTIQSRSHIVQVGNKKILNQMITQFVKNQSYTLSELTETIWQSHYNPSYYHRIRVAVNRLNDILFQITGIYKCITVDSENIKVIDALSISIE